MQPIIAIVADIREFDNELWHCVPEQYLDAVCKVANVLPLFVPALGDQINIDRLLDRVDGVMLTGSKANVHPSHYGVEADERYEPYDLKRDATTLPLVRAAVEKGIPFFAICRGIQEMNVALGGSIEPQIHTLKGRLDHRAADTPDRDLQFAINKTITARKGGCIDQMLGSHPKVNSLHSQGILKLAPRLRVEAKADDGTIEAVSVIDAKGYAIGVQWHPEYWAETDATSRKLFESFGDAVRQYLKEKK